LTSPVATASAVGTAQIPARYEDGHTTGGSQYIDPLTF